MPRLAIALILAVVMVLFIVGACLTSRRADEAADKVRRDLAKLEPWLDAMERRAKRAERARNADLGIIKAGRGVHPEKHRTKGRS